MALDATIGGTTSNSYVTENEANTYFETRPHASAWDQADDSEAALISASRTLDWYMKWLGTKASTTQSMEWPRASTYDRDGVSIATDIIPVRVKDAVFELALFNLDADRLADHDMEGFSDMAIGPLKLKKPSSGRTSKKKAIPSHVRQILSDYVSNGIGVKRLVRM